MANPIRPNTLADGQTIDALRFNEDFDTIYAWAVNEAMHRDGSTAFAVLPSGPGGGALPTQSAQVTNKLYVDQQDALRLATNVDTVSVNNKLGIGDGSPTTAALHFKNDPDTGITRSSGGAGVGLALQVGGVVSLSFPETTGYPTFHKRMWAPGMLQSSSGGQEVRRNTVDGNELFAYTSSAGMKENVRTTDAVQDEYVAKLLATELPVWDALRTTPEGDIVPASRAGSQRGTSWDRMGPILEDMARTFPEAVMRDDDGAPVGLDESLLLSVLWQAVKNLSA